jgi:hypothetical protein
LLSLFRVKLSHFTTNEFFLYVTNAKAYHQKTEKSSLVKKKSFIGSATAGAFFAQQKDSVTTVS